MYFLEGTVCLWSIMVKVSRRYTLKSISMLDVSKPALVLVYGFRG